jgi:hypothetical protein
VNTTGSGFHLPEDDGVIEITSLLDGHSVTFIISDFFSANSTIVHVTVHYHEVDASPKCAIVSVSGEIDLFTAQCFEGIATVTVYVYLQGSEVPENGDACPEAAYEFDDLVALEFELPCSYDNSKCSAPPSSEPTHMPAIIDPDPDPPTCGPTVSPAQAPDSSIDLDDAGFVEIEDWDYDFGLDGFGPGGEGKDDTFNFGELDDGESKIGSGGRGPPEELPKDLCDEQP